MSPQSLRSAIKRGQWTAAVDVKDVPGPPAEWKAWKKRRMAVAIRCAVLFLFHAKRSPEIIDIVGKEKLFTQKRVTKSRVLQYVDRGTRFLLENGVFVEVKRK